MSGVSVATGQKNGRSNRKRNPEKENVEYRRNVFYLFLKKKMERSLRLVGVLTPTPRRAIPHFDIRYSIFCGSLFSPTADCQSDQSNHQQTVPFWRSFIQEVQGSEVQGSGFSAAAGQKNGRSNRKRNPEKENIEYRIMNVECRRNEFCGSLFLPREVSCKVSDVRKASRLILKPEH